MSTTASSTCTLTKPQLSQEIVTQTSEIASTSTTMTLLHWQVSRFDMPGTSPCVVICVRGHPSPRDALELVNLPPLSAFWETALSARLFHGVDFDFSTGCMFDLKLWGVNIIDWRLNRVVAIAHIVWRQGQGYACSYVDPLSIYWDSRE